MLLFVLGGIAWTRHNRKQRENEAARATAILDDINRKGIEQKKKMEKKWEERAKQNPTPQPSSP